MSAGGTPDLAQAAESMWRDGDHEALVALPGDAVEAHPQRQHIALHMAAACLQLGRIDDARHHAGLARDWGCDVQETAGLLLGAVHDTLGQAAAALGQDLRAMEHFRAATAGDLASSVAPQALASHAAARYAQMGLTAPAGLGDSAGARPSARPGALAQALQALADTSQALARRHDELAAREQQLLAGLSQWQRAVEQALQTQGERLEARVAAALDTLEARQQALSGHEQALRDEMTAWRKALQLSLREQFTNMTRQLQAHAELRQHLDSKTLLPMLHGWAVSADFARHLLSMIDTNDYDAIVEFGSGTSTVLMATSLQAAAQRGGTRLPRLMTFEHDAGYHRRTQAQLAADGVAEHCDLRLAPLVPFTAADGITYRYYDAREALATLARHLALPAPRLLAIVDGPPSSTGEHARYPALPSLLAAFPGGAFDLLLDDYKRRDEKEVVRMWQADVEALGYKTELIEFDFEKKACLLRAVPGHDAQAAPTDDRR